MYISSIIQECVYFSYYTCPCTIQYVYMWKLYKCCMCSNLI